MIELLMIWKMHCRYQRPKTLQSQRTEKPNLLLRSCLTKLNLVTSVTKQKGVVREITIKSQSWNKQWRRFVTP